MPLNIRSISPCVCTTLSRKVGFAAITPLGHSGRIEVSHNAVFRELSYSESYGSALLAEGYFETLRKAAADAERESASWQDYANFCRDSERGLRSQAFSTLGRFISRMEIEPFAERRRFVSWLMRMSYRQSGRHMLLPYPLTRRIVEPTLLEWTLVEPEASEPHRWMGGLEHLEQAVELDPSDLIALRELVITLLSQVSYTTHELPAGYLGVVSQDLAALSKAEALLPRLADEEDRAAYAADIAENRGAIDQYVKRQNLHP